MPATLNHDLLVAAASQDFALFATLMFPEIEPGKSMTLSWHINHIAFLGREMAEGREKRIIVNLPPSVLEVDPHFSAAGRLSHGQ